MPNAILGTAPLGRRWPTLDPFLFCVHHVDEYPRGNANMGIDARELRGRQIGSDFSEKDGWSMYHGEEVPGFPRHPHRGFETVTLARQGYVDHADSSGAGARFGQGDAQWMTAGKGIVHSEMFPLLHTDALNPTELFQIWLNLPASDKHAAPYFTMMWRHQIPSRVVLQGPRVVGAVTCIAGHLGENEPPPPPPRSWASRDDAEVVIATLALTAHGAWTLPPASAAVTRVLYFFKGDSIGVNGVRVAARQAIELDSTEAVTLEATDPVEVLLLQGRPIGESVVAHGPFVMNTEDEIREALIDYQQGQFGEWRWGANGPVYPRSASRFASHADGRLERPAR